MYQTLDQLRPSVGEWFASKDWNHDPDLARFQVEKITPCGTEGTCYGIYCPRYNVHTAVMGGCLAKRLDS